jgi:hypothetical protein
MYLIIDCVLKLVDMPTYLLKSRVNTLVALAPTESNGPAVKGGVQEAHVA